MKNLHLSTQSRRTDAVSTYGIARYVLGAIAFLLALDAPCASWTYCG